MKKPRIEVWRRGQDNRIRPYPVVRNEGYADGFMVHFKVQERLEYVAVPWSYQYGINDRNGKLVVGALEGSVTAVSILGMPVENAPGEEYAALLRTHQYAEGHKQLFSTLNIPWKWLLAVLGILAVLAVVYFVFLRGEEAPPATEPQDIPVQQIEVD